MSDKTEHDQKVAFASKEEAEAARIHTENSFKDTNLTVYLCNKCQLWHLSSKYD